MSKSNFNSMVRAVIPTEIKDQVVEVLRKKGLTQTDVILDLYKYIAMYKDIPFDKEEIVTLKER